MKKLLFLPILCLAAACNKSSIQPAAPDKAATQAPMKQATVATSFATTQSFSGYTSNGKEIYSGLFSVTGLFTGAGTTYEIVNVNFPSGGSGSAIANAVFTFTSSQTFSFAGGGSLTVQTNGTWWFTGPTSGAGSGSWQVVSGTGSYANVKGSGNLTISEIKFNETGAYEISDIYEGGLYSKD